MIRGEKVILRTVREADLDHLFALTSDLAVRGEFLPLDLPSEVEFKKRFQEHGLMSGDEGTLLICVNDQIIGTISFSRVMYFDGLEIGYRLFGQENWNKGYMTEALSLFVKYLFATKKVNRLQLAVNPANTASKKVAAKCGFMFEGTLRGAFFCRGKHHDLELYSLLRTEAALS